VSIFKSIDSNYCVAVRDPMYISQITTAPKPEKIIYYKVLTRDRSDHFSNISYSCGHGLARKISAKRRYLATFSSPCLHAYGRIDCSDSCLEPFSHVTLNCDPRATTLVFEQDLYSQTSLTGYPLSGFCVVPIRHNARYKTWINGYSSRVHTHNQVPVLSS